MSFCPASIVRRFAGSTPDAPALTFEDRTLSFRELDDRSSRVANALAALGVGRGDRVAILALNSDRYFELMYAVPCMGALIAARSAP